MTTAAMPRDGVALPNHVFEDLWLSANDVLFVYDLQGRFLAVNAAAGNTYGYTRDEFLRLNIADLVDPGSLPAARQQMQAKVSGSQERSAPYELLTRTKDGRHVWIEVTSRTVRDGDRIVAIQGAARDITARKDAERVADLVHEAALALVQAKTLESGVEQVLGQVAGAAGWLYAEAWFPDPEGAYIAVGPQWSAGAGHEKFLRLAKQLHYEKGEGLAGWVWQHQTTLSGRNLPEDGRFPRLAAAKAAGFASFTAVPVLHDGQFLACLLFFGGPARRNDEAWVRAAEKVARQLGAVMSRRVEVERIRLAGRMFAAQFEALDDALLLLDKQGTPRHANAAFLRLCGARLTSTDAAVPLLERVEDREGFLLAVAALYEDRRAGLQEVDFDRRRWHRTLRPLRSRSGEDLGFLLQLSDPVAKP